MPVVLISPQFGGTRHASRVLGDYFQCAVMLRYLLIDIPPRRRALTLWAILAVAVCVKTALLGGDYSVYRMFDGGSRHWWADKSLYANYTITEALDGYRYSPTFAVAFTPFYLLRDPYGAIVWGLVSIAVLVWALHVLVRDVLPCPRWHTDAWLPDQEGWFLGLALVGSILGIWALQSNAIVTALIALALAAIVRQRWWTASWLLAVPVFIKLWPIAIVLLLVVCWPRQLIGRLAAVGAALASIPFLTRPPNIVMWQYHQWYASLTGPLQGRWPGYRDAWTVWEQLCPLVRCQADLAPYRHTYMALQLLTAMAVLGWCFWQRRRVQSVGRLLTLILSMWASWQLLLGPGTEQLTYGIIAPSASWAVLVSFAEKRARWATVTAWAMLSLLPAGDIEQAAIAVCPGGKALLPLGVVLLVAWLVWHERGKSPETQVASFPMS